MNNIVNFNKHSKSAFLYAISNGFEKASYYGMRSILVLFMVSETINMSRVEALSFYYKYIFVKIYWSIVW